MRCTVLYAYCRAAGSHYVRRHPWSGVRGEPVKLLDKNLKNVYEYSKRQMILLLPLRRWGDWCAPRIFWKENSQSQHYIALLPNASVPLSPNWQPWRERSYSAHYSLSILERLFLCMQVHGNIVNMNYSSFSAERGRWPLVVFKCSFSYLFTTERRWKT